MSLYQKFGTDRALEKTGIILDYGDGVKIRIARAGGANDAYAKRMEAKAKPHKRAIQTDTADKNVLDGVVKEVYAETVVLGWEGVTDQDGNEMVFSKENCVKLFNDLPDLWADVQAQAQQGTLFRMGVLETDAKN